jgi:peptidyl-prolyl cis-trans isomerase SurA
MIKRTIGLFMLGWIATGTFAQPKETIVTIGNRQFTKEEFVRIYEKNNANLLEDSEKKTPEEYMELFINYKLKVIEAENLKMDTLPSFIRELETYRQELAAPYLTDVRYTEKQVKELYERMQNEVKASHLLIAMDNNPSPEDTLAAYRKILKVRKEIMDGLPFKEAAIKYSDDPSAAANHGDLGYFSAFQMIYPFEEAAFDTPVGEISMPVRTSYGYHLIYVADKRKAKGDLKVAHIMKSFPPDVDASIMKKLKNEIDSIYRLLEKGEDFAELARKYSDDKNSAANGGELNWFSSGRMIADFSEPAFELKENGAYTEPIITQYGYHIIKRLDHRPVRSFEEVKDEIERRIKTDPERSVHSRTAFLAKLKEEYDFRVAEKTAAEIAANRYSLDPQNPDTREKKLFTLNDADFTVGSFFEFVARNYPQTKEFDEPRFRKYFDEWVGEELIAYEDSHLEEKYPDFKYLMQEYHDGILLFNISDDKIWSFAAKDTTGLEKYYKKHASDHLWDERFKGCIIHCVDMETREEADTYFSAGMTTREILDLINQETERITIEEGAWEENTNPIVTYYVWNGEKPEGFNEELDYIRGDVFPPEPKKLEEARGLYLSDYQNYLENEWIKKLRKKYKIKINKKLLKTIPHVAE